MQVVLDRIAAWQAAGLIDPETALRLRSDEAGREAATDDAVPTETHRGPSTVAHIFGPGVTIGEMFAYLGGAFLLGSYNAFIVRTSGFQAEGSVGLAVGFGLAAVALVLIGRYLRDGDSRRRRAAGVVFSVAVAQVAAAGAAVTAAAGIDFATAAVITALITAEVAAILRTLHPAVLTQATLLASLTGLAAALLSWVEQAVVPEPVYTESGAFDPTGRPEPLVLVVVAAAWWLGFALILGVLGLREARAGTAAGGRRAALTRLWAGITAVVGLATAVNQSGYDPATGAWGRVLEPWIGDLALIVLALVLVERAFRRGANTFVYAAALAVIIALTDFNFSYLTDSTEAGLLVEGLILLGAGFAVSRLRQRIGGDETPQEGATLRAPT